MKTLSIVSAGGLLCVSVFAQNPASPHPPAAKPQPKMPSMSLGDSEAEAENRKLMLEKMKTAQSDESGKPRPDLQAQGLAHVQRMQVAGRIGPAQKEPSKDQK